MKKLTELLLETQNKNFDEEIKTFIKTCNDLKISGIKDAGIRKGGGENDPITDGSDVKNRKTAFYYRYHLDKSVPEFSDMNTTRYAVRETLINALKTYGAKEGSPNSTGTVNIDCSVNNRDIKVYIKCTDFGKGIEAEKMFSGKISDILTKQAEENAKQMDKAVNSENPDIDSEATPKGSAKPTFKKTNILFVDESGKKELWCEGVTSIVNASTQKTQAQDAKSVPSRIDFIIKKQSGNVNISLKKENYLYVDNVGGKRIKNMGIEKFFIDNIDKIKTISVEPDGELIVKLNGSNIKKSLKAGDTNFKVEDIYYGKCDVVLVVPSSGMKDGGLKQHSNGETYNVLICKEIHLKTENDLPELELYIKNHSKRFFGVVKKVKRSENNNKLFTTKSDSDTEKIYGIHGNVVIKK